jgi:uncharacterized protein YutD
LFSNEKYTQALKNILKDKDMTIPEHANEHLSIKKLKISDNKEEEKKEKLSIKLE